MNHCPDHILTRAGPGIAGHHLFPGRTTKRVLGEGPSSQVVVYGSEMKAGGGYQTGNQPCGVLRWSSNLFGALCFLHMRFIDGYTNRVKRFLDSPIFYVIRNVLR